MRFFATLLVCACARARCLQSGDLYATNPETGAVTIMHTSFVNATTEHTNQPGPVVPINSGDPHTYFPGHEMSPRRVRRPYEGAGLDSVTESPQEAAFRRHFKMFKKYLGTDGEDPYTAAYRIWAMHPSMSSGMEPEEDEEEEEDEGAAEEDEGAAAEDEGVAADRATAAVALGLVGRVTGEGMLRWMHSQLVVAGAGGAGKSSCVAALAGRTFDPDRASTVSVGVAPV